MHFTLTRRGIPRLLVVAAIAAAALAFAAGARAADSVYTWPGAVMLHVHTTPADSSPGYVQSDPYYIDCPNACDRPYDPGQSVTLWAYPTGGFAFTSWTTGPCAGTSVNPCTFTITQDTDVTADYSGHYMPTQPQENNNLQVYPQAFVCCGPIAPTKTPKVAIPADFLGGVSTDDGQIHCSTFFAYFLDERDGCGGNFPEGSSVVLHVDQGNPFCAFFLGWEDNGSEVADHTLVMSGNRFAVPVFAVNPLCLI